MLQSLKKQNFIKNFDNIKSKKMLDKEIKEDIIKDIKCLMKIINEVEDTAIQLKLGIINYKDMKKENDYFYRNKFERFQHTKSFVKMFLYQILNPEDLYREPEDSNIEIIELIFRFKRQMLA